MTCRRMRTFKRFVESKDNCHESKNYISDIHISKSKMVLVYSMDIPNSPSGEIFRQIGTLFQVTKTL